MSYAPAQTKPNLLRRIWDSFGRQSLGLSHNKTMATVQKIKSTFSPEMRRQQTVLLVSHASGHSSEQIGAWYDESIEMIRSSTEQDDELWRSRTRSLMSLEDRMVLYTILQAFHPHICIETGTSGGASATVTLNSIRQLGDGKLYSVEIESENQAEYGILIPE